jgi:hypothetical protein
MLLGLCEELSLIDPFRALYPNKSDFSYVPRRVGAQHRSRLDFFLISDILLQNCKDCYIYDNLQSSLFDHKAVNLSFSGSITGSSIITNVNNKILRDPDAGIIVDLACKEAHLIYQDMPREVKSRLLTSIGRCKQLLREAGPCTNYYKMYFSNEQVDNVAERTEKINNVNFIIFQEELCYSLYNQINIEEDLFFEM